MVRKTILLVAVILLAAGVPLVGQTPETSPAEIGATEEVEVRYILIDTLVESVHGNTIPGLGKSDFQLTVDGTLHDIDSLDVFCDAGALPPAARDSSGDYPAAADVERKIVILVSSDSCSVGRIPIINRRASRIAAASLHCCQVAPRLASKRLNADPDRCCG